MRALQRHLAGTTAAAVAVPSQRWFAQGSLAPAPRSSVLARWTGHASDKAVAASSSGQGIFGKGMSFASGLLRDVSPSTRKASTNATTDATVGDVPWDLCERMDYYVQYNVPSSWQVAEVLRDNSIAIQCSPPSPPNSDAASRAHVHGISLNCFAYKQRVKQPDSVKLLHVFLKRFNASVGNSLELIAEGHPLPSSAEVKLPGRDSGEASASAPSEASPLSSQQSAEEEGTEGTCQKLAKQLNSAVAEISFTPAPGQALAHGLCRAFFNSNGRFHYVIVVAVPEEEYAHSIDLIIHAMASVVESRVEAAAKLT